MQLFEQNEEWAKGIARAIMRKLPPSFEVADLEQECLLELWKRTETYDKSKNGNFRGYAYVWVRGAALMTCRRRHYIAATGEEIEDGIDSRPNVHEQLENRQEEKREARRDSRRRARVLKALDRFPPASALEAYLIRNVYLGEIEIDEAQKVTGMSAQAIRKRLASGIRMLRRMKT